MRLQGKIEPLLLLLFVLTSGLGFSQTNFQKAYVVSNQMDTTYGWIDVKNPSVISSKVYFKKDSLGHTVSYLPGEIHAFSIDNRDYYVSKEVPELNNKTEYFLQYLVDGQVDLYYVNTFGKKRYYLEKNGELHPLENDISVYQKDGKTYQKESKDYTGVLKFLLQETPDLYSEIDKLNFQHPELIDLTKKYHDKVCENDACIIYYTDRKKLDKSKWTVKLNPEIAFHWNRYDLSLNLANYPIVLEDGFLGIPMYSIQSSTLHSEDYAGSDVPALNLQISNGNRSAFVTGICIHRLKVSDYKSLLIGMPLTVHYNFRPYEKVRPFVKIGAIINYFASQAFDDFAIVSKKYITTDWNDNRIYEYDTLLYGNDAIDFENSIKLGYTMGTGIKFKINSELDGLLSVNYSWINRRKFEFDLQDDVIVKGRIELQSYSFTLGVIF